MNLFLQLALTVLLSRLWLRVWGEIKDMERTQGVSFLGLGQRYYRHGSRQRFVNFADIFLLNFTFLLGLPFGILWFLLAKFGWI